MKAPKYLAILLISKILMRLEIKISKDCDMCHCYLKKERKNLRDYPTHLKFREMIKPSSVLKKIFKRYKLADYQRILNIWLHDALSKHFMEESLTKAEVIKVYEQLVKLYEAMWLISERVKRGG